MTVVQCPVMETKECPVCGKGKPLSDFSGRHRTCRACRTAEKRDADAKRTAEDPHWRRDQKIAAHARKLGVTVDEFLALRQQPCGVCGKEGEVLSPYTGNGETLLGWICKSCNRGLGILGHDPARLKRALHMWN